MADSTYKGGLPQEGFHTNLGVSNEAESKGTPGGADAHSPKVVKQGEGGHFVNDSSYRTGMEVGRGGKSKTVNPDSISNKC